jgi:hypothetical protein
VKTAFVTLDANPPLLPRRGDEKLAVFVKSTTHFVYCFLFLPSGAGVNKKSRPFGPGSYLNLFSLLCFGKYYPASFFKEVIKEKIKSICDDCFHSESNIESKSCCKKFIKLTLVHPTLTLHFRRG